MASQDFMNSPTEERRKSAGADRRDVPRGGRRVTDLPHPLVCPNCAKIHDVKGLPSSRVVRWCRCEACGEVWPWSIEL